MGVDQAVRAYFADPGRRTLAAVVALGPAALDRVNDVYFGRSQVDYRPPGPRVGDRELLDRWAVLRSALAQAYPDEYLTAIGTGRVPLSPPGAELVTLGRIDDPRATALLLRHVDHPQWLVRRHAIEGLAGRDDDGALAAVESALADEPMVRLAAIAAVARRDPDRAATLYRDTLADERLTPVLRKEILRHL